MLSSQFTQTHISQRCSCKLAPVILKCTSRPLLSAHAWRTLHCSDATPLCSCVSSQSSRCGAVLRLGGHWAVWSPALSRAPDPSLHILSASPCDCSVRADLCPDPLRSLRATSWVTLWPGPLPTPRPPAVAEEGVLTGPGLTGMTGMRSVEGKRTGLQSQRWGLSGICH